MMGFQNLTDGGGNHIALALEESPVGGDNAHQESAGAQAYNGKPGIGLLQSIRQLAAEEHHKARTGGTDDEEQGSGGLIDPPHLVFVAQGAGLADHAAHGHGQTCGGYQKQNGINVVGGGEIAVTLIADDHFQGQLVQRADDLHHSGGNGQKGRTVEEGLLFGSL